MGRLIEIQHVQVVPPSLTLEAGDVLIFDATGGRVQSNSGVMEFLGPFLPGVIGDNGQILSPMGTPNTILFLARRPGRATIDVVIGEPWNASRTITLDITVKP